MAAKDGAEDDTRSVFSSTLVGFGFRKCKPTKFFVCVVVIYRKGDFFLFYKQLGLVLREGQRDYTYRCYREIRRSRQGEARERL